MGAERIAEAVALIVLLVTAGMVILSQLGVRLRPMIAAAGIGGLAHWLRLTESRARYHQRFLHPLEDQCASEMLYN